MYHPLSRRNIGTITFTYLITAVLCLLLAGCDITLSGSGIGSNQCQSNCTIGSGTQGLRVFVEPNAGEQVITGAIGSAKKSVELEMYILTDTKVIHALEDAANRGIDVRVMLEPHPFGSSSPSRTMDELSAAGVKAQTTSSAFPLTHEKGMIIDHSTAYIMTSNFSRSALGGSSRYLSNREYDIIDTNPRDVQAVEAIFNPHSNRTPAQFNDSTLFLSPIHSRNDFTSLINSAH